MSENKCLLQVENLNVYYGSIHAIKDISFHVLHWRSTAAWYKIRVVAEGYQRRTLCGSVAHGDREVYALEKSLYLLVQCRTAHYYLVCVAAKGLQHQLADTLLHLFIYYRHVPKQSHLVVLYSWEHALAYYLLHHQRHRDDYRRLYIGKGLCYDGR